MKIFVVFLLGMGVTALTSFGYSALRRKEDNLKLHSLIEGSPIPTFVIQKDHKVLYWNKALEELSRIKAAEVTDTNQHWRAFYKMERPCMADLIVDETLETVSDWYSGKFKKSPLIEDAYQAVDFFPDIGDGGRWLRFTAAAIKDSRGRIFGAIETLEDFTEQKIAEEELFRIKKLESLGIFAGGVARDFDSLISAILRSIFLTKLSATNEDKVMEEGLAIAEKASLQAKELAHQLITFAKGGYPLRKLEATEPLLRESIESIRPGIKADIHMDLRLPGGLWPVEVDKDQIRQVIENIVVNAAEAMPMGGNIRLAANNITLGAKELPPLKPGRYLRLSVQDNGTGIKKEHLLRIYEPYFTTKTTGGRRGIGLGLAVCYSILMNHNGFICVESEEGRGTTVKVFLPAAGPS